MEPLLEIRTTDIVMGYRNCTPKVEMESEPVSYNMQRTPGGFDIDYKPGKLKYDTYTARKSLGYMSPMDAFRKCADQAQQTAQMATARYAQEGNTVMNAINDNNIFSEISAQRMAQLPDTKIAFLPSDSVDFDWDPQEFSMKYEADKLRFDWKTDSPEFRVTPGNLEFYVKQYPSVDIKYIGGAFYVPPSADPEYEEKKMNYLA